MSFEDFFKKERMPTQWCAGCGTSMTFTNLCKVFDELGFNHKNTVVVSGIGCTGRSAGYFNLDSVHGLHGRAIPLAEGIKLANDKLNVVVLSGDGDLLGIGANHLIHCARRNTNITVICAVNEIYGMTGGQKAPTTRKGAVTVTSPQGNEETPINAQAIIKAHKNFYARSTTYHVKHLRKSMKEALNHKGFSFVDVKSQCPTNFGRRMGFKNAYDMLKWYKENYKINDNITLLKDNEIGITKNE